MSSYARSLVPAACVGHVAHSLEHLLVIYLYYIYASISIFVYKESRYISASISVHLKRVSYQQFGVWHIAHSLSIVS